MNVLFVIARSEFMRRVTSRAFLLTTLLGPLALVAFMAITVAISISVAESEEETERVIAVVDETGFVIDSLEHDSYTFVAADSATARARVISGRYDGYVVIPAAAAIGEGSLKYFSMEGGGFGVANDVRGTVRRTIRDQRMASADISPDVLDIIYMPRLGVTSVRISETGEDSGSSWTYGALGGIMGMLIYMTMIIYGSVVSQGVMEEKQSRIVEVIVSSAKPFDLLMGKVLGIGAMGLAQLLTWGLLVLGVTTFGGSMIGLVLDPADLDLDTTASAEDMLAASGISLPRLPLSVLVWFLLFFLGGYLLYAGLFAAVGAMVDQPQDAQYLMLPVMLPIIVPMIFISSILQSPNSTLAVVLSMIPLTSPVPMVLRLSSTTVPFWEVLLSFLILVAGFVGTIWISSRIYRMGILMYGKKATLKDALRWIRRP